MTTRTFPAVAILVCAAASVGLGTSSAQSISFAARRDVLTGIARMSSVAIGDFNNDGTPDAAIAGSFYDRGGDAVAVLLGNGDGSYQPPMMFTAGAGPRSIVTADFNGDGNADLIVTNFDLNYANTVTVLLGNGDGTFQQPPLTTTVELSPIHLAVADFNGDGVPDVAVADYRADRVSILIGNGDGTFVSEAALEVGVSPIAVATADFNGDGLTDIAVANAGASTVSVLLGRGDGTFEPQVTTALSGPPSSLVAADFNSDGLADIVVSTTTDGTASTATVGVLFGNGDATLQPQQIICSGGGALVLADLNGDGVMDVVVGIGPQELVQPLVANGDGTFRQAPASRVAAVSPTWMVAADVNRDGVTDIVTVNTAGGGPDSVSFLYGNGDGSFNTAPNVALDAGAPSPVVADFNGDGIPDLAVATGSDANAVWILLANGDGTFNSTKFDAGISATAMAAGDFTGDGIVDLLVGGYSTITLLRGNGDGTFAAPTVVWTAASRRITAIAAGDLNRDGLLDALVASTDTSSSVSVIALVGRGDGTFSIGSTTAAGGSGGGALVAADFNGDGILDFAVSSGPDEIGIAIGNGNGSFQRLSTVFVEQTWGLAAADLDGDGAVDLVATGYGAVVLTGNGDGTFGTRRIILPDIGIPFTAPVIADFNGDGIPDIATATYLERTVAVVPGTGCAQFAAPLYFGADNGPIGVSVIDFNLDGVPDLAVTNVYSGTLSLLRNTSLTGW